MYHPKSVYRAERNRPKRSAYAAGIARVSKTSSLTSNNSESLFPAIDKAKKTAATVEGKIEQGKEFIKSGMVKREPQFGIPLPLNSDSRFPHSAGFQKMQANHTLPDGSNITIHYQYNAITGKAYDMKFVTRQNITPELQPGPTFKD